MGKKRYYTVPQKNNKKLSEKDFQNREKILRGFFLKNSDILRLTRITWGPALFGFITSINKKSGKIWGADKDLKFIKFKDSIKKDFIKKVANNKKYEDIKQPLNQKFEHYFYKLSKKVKDLLNNETLFFTNINNYYNSDNFYGFEDPTFYKNKKMAGCVISHELQISLFLTKKEKDILERKGIDLIEPIN